MLELLPGEEHLPQLVADRRLCAVALRDQGDMDLRVLARFTGLTPARCKEVMKGNMDAKHIGEVSPGWFGFEDRRWFLTDTGRAELK